MKIKTKVLTNFLNKFRMSGSQKVDEAILRFEKDGLKVRVDSPAKQARVTGWLKTSAFESYSELGNVCLNDLENVKRALERFGEKISLKKDGNLLVVKGDNKKVEIELMSEEFMETLAQDPQIEFEDTFIIKSEQIKNIFDDVRMNKDAQLMIKTEDKKVQFSNTGKYKFNNVLEAPMCKGGVSVKFGSALLDALNGIDSQLEISVKTDYPVKAMEKSEHSILTFIVAPMVEN